MTVLATPGSVEERLAGVSVAGEQFLDGIRSWNAGGLERFFGPLVEKRGDVSHLFIGHVGQGRHAFIGTASANDFADEVTFDVMSDKRRANKIRAARARGVRTMAESARLPKLLAAALDGRIFCRHILCL